MSTVTSLSGSGFHLGLCLVCGVVLAWMLVCVLDRLATKESFFATSCPAPADSAHHRTPPTALDRCPKCRWVCQPSECAKSCTPICSPPACRIKCKPLAALAMIDEGEVDWKLIVINVADPLADKV